MLRPAIVAIPALLAAVPAAAEPNRCATADSDLEYKGTDIPEFGGDTGWIPGGSPAQIRLAAHLEGHTAVSAGYTAKGCWQDGMKGSLAGRPGTGYLDVAYGADLSLKARIHTSILGKSIDWEGNIPIPYIPSDLLIADTTDFTPRLPTTVAATVSDSTQAVNVISTDVIGNFISIPGISGGLHISVRGSMTSTYRAKTTSFADGTVDSLEDLVSIAQPGAGFHSSLEMPLTVDGVVHYAPKLTFAAGFDVTILGFKVVDWDIATVSMSLPSLDRNVKLEGEPAVLPLPEMDGLGDGARMDFAAGATQTIHVKNTGQGPLELVPTNLPAGVTAAPLTLAPGAQGDLSVTAAAGALASTASLTVQTNDPDRPTVEVELGMQNGGTDGGKADGEVGEPDGGCSTGSGQGAGLILFALGFVAIRRRRS